MAAVVARCNFTRHRLVVTAPDVRARLNLRARRLVRPWLYFVARLLSGGLCAGLLARRLVRAWLYFVARLLARGFGTRLVALCLTARDGVLALRRRPPGVL